MSQANIIKNDFIIITTHKINPKINISSFKEVFMKSNKNVSQICQSLSESFFLRLKFIFGVYLKLESKLDKISVFFLYTLYSAPPEYEFQNYFPFLEISRIRIGMG